MSEDRKTEKTNLLYTYAIDDLKCDYEPCFSSDYKFRTKFEDQEYDLQLLDLAGLEDYRKVRALSYPQTDVFILFFSLISPTSLENIENGWVPEIQMNCQDPKFILVGGNSALRDSFQEHYDEYKSKGWEPVPSEKGDEMRRKIKAIDYIECDADSKYNVKEVFERAMHIALHNIQFQDTEEKPHKTKKVSKFKQWKEKRKEKKSKKDKE